MAVRHCNVKLSSDCKGTVTRHSKTGACAPCSKVRESRERTKPKFDNATSAFEASGDQATLTTKTDQDVRSLDDLIRVCQIDTNEWEVERWIANKWEMGYKDKAQQAHTKPLFQIKAWLKRKVEVINARAEIAAMLADAKKQIKPSPAPAIVKNIGNRHYMSEIAIPDLHLGKLAWGEETGHGNYDIRIAEYLFKEALEVLIERTKSVQFERVLFPLGHDFFNADNLANTTTKGTAQDVDGRFQKTFRIGRKLAIYAIERLRAVAPIVDVAVVPGNHDTLSTWLLGELLATKYESTQGVTILNEPTPRKYIHYHKNMVMLTHGDKGKRQDYPLLMATEQSAMFGATIHREAHVGHWHTTNLQEKHGVRVRTSPALCAADAWHAENAYVGNARAAECFVWHRTEGIVTIANYTVPVTEGKKKSA